MCVCGGGGCSNPLFSLNPNYFIFMKNDRNVWLTDQIEAPSANLNSLSENPGPAPALVLVYKKLYSNLVVCIGVLCRSNSISVI